MVLLKSLTRDDAKAELHKLYYKKDACVHLVPFPFAKFNQLQKLRFERYQSFHVLCHNNTYKHAGWLVCKFSMTGGCPLSKSLLVFNSASGGTGRLERHISHHNRLNQLNITLPRSISSFSKQEVAKCAALAVALDLRSICFTENKEGLSRFAGAIFKLGQATPTGENIDSKSIFPSAKTVSGALSTLAKDCVQNFKGQLGEIISLGGGVTTDGVTLQVQDKQFYDLTLHYLSVRSLSPFDMSPKFQMECRTLLLQEKRGNGGAEQIRSLLNNGLLKLYVTDFDKLTEGFAMVTDNASVMARVAGASVSTRIAPMGEKWMGCLVYQIKTAMKCYIEETANQSELLDVSDDIKSVKKIVRIFKQSSWNSLLPSGFNLLQEVETRFATTHHVVARFLKSASFVQEIIDSKDSIPARNALDSLHMSAQPCGLVVYPALEAVGDAFSDIVALQQRLEASTTPTINLALPELQICMEKLTNIAEGGSVYRGKLRGFIPASSISRKLCRSTLEWLQAKVRIHPLMMAGCFLNPLFREFQFLGDVNKRREYRSSAETIIRSIMLRQNDDTEQTASDTHSETI